MIQNSIWNWQGIYSEMMSEGDQPSLLLNLWGLAYTLILVIASLIGAIRGLKRGNRHLRGLIILALLTIAYLVLSPGAAGEARFRVPVEPLLAFHAALTFLGIPNAEVREEEIILIQNEFSEKNESD
ncbi:MAG: hypothetical protein A2Z14_16300 [Chloroflexi bacterium RBG_16_48_8]|nr:MAG: hypothetical protein A2Z14_16300 [Chloroflexi bacterium RBG_16_48_8]